MSKVIALIGSRTRDTEEDRQLLRDEFFKHYEEGDILLSGGCPIGGDKFAEDIADELFMPIIRKIDGLEIEREDGVMYVHTADWQLFGKSAGYIRNKYIARDCDILISLRKKSGEGGAENTVRTAKQLNKKVIEL